MKFCTKCGNELIDEAVVCTKCGCLVEKVQQKNNSESGLKTAAKIFMILGTIGLGISCFLIPLAWCIPMTVVYFSKIKKGEPVGTGFKVCSLLFVNTIAGILMLCDKD